MMIQNFRYQLLYFDSTIFKGLSQIKAIVSEEQKTWLCNIVQSFWDSHIRKTTEDIGSWCSFGWSLPPADAEYWNQPAAVTGQAAAHTKAHHGTDFCISCCKYAQSNTSGLSRERIYMSHHRKESQWKDTGLYCGWQFYLEEC